MIAHDSERTDLQTEVEEVVQMNRSGAAIRSRRHLVPHRVDRVELTSVNPSLNQRTTSHHGHRLAEGWAQGHRACSG